MYRDVSEPTPAPSPRRPAADDAAYWYDLLAEDAAPQHEQARGPFEPLLPSGTPTGAVGQQPSVEPEQGSPGVAGNDRQEAPEQARARKLEQIKDLYLTAEAIGEANVDKHFDHLQAQQRELISEYFKQSSATRPAVGAADQAGAEPASVAGQEPGDPGEVAPAGGPAGAAESARVTADHPRAW